MEGDDVAQEVIISFYGGCFEAMGLPEASHPLAEECTVEEFVDSVAQAHPALKRLRRIIVCARDDEYLEPPDTVRPGDRIVMMSALT